MGEFDYEKLLDRARENIPEEISGDARWKLPEPDVLIEGQQTIIRNFAELTEKMDRDSNHVFQFLQNELGTSGMREEHRVLLKGRIPPRRIKEKLGNYVRTYILCGQCNAPDTRFLKEDRTTLLKCQACGATRPVKM
jgi:translation initiation factor 2 subunit 2